MAGMISTQKTSLLTILDDACNILFSPTVCKTRAEVKALTNCIELPVIEDSISVDMGSVDVAYTKLTDGTTVAGKFSKGDPSCSFQIASIADAVNGIFAKAVDTDQDATTGAIDVNGIFAKDVDTDQDATTGAIDVNGQTETGGPKLKAYSNGLNVNHGTLVIANADYTHMVVFPNTAISGSFNPTGGGNANTGYWNCSFIPYATTGTGSDGASFYIG